MENIDFWKAFDSVPHNNLLTKLWGIRNWFDCYLTKPSIELSTCSLWSTPGKHTGPPLFLVFINDLPTVITSQLFEFADDTKCFRQITSALSRQTSITADLNSLSNWSINNLLSFNLSKFIFMSSHRKFTSMYVTNGHTINKSSSCKDLGIIFTNTLTWREHYEMIFAKAYKSLGLLLRVFKNSHSPQVTKSIYISLVQAKLLYCSPLWKPYLLKDIRVTWGSSVESN